MRRSIRVSGGQSSGHVDVGDPRRRVSLPRWTLTRPHRTWVWAAQRARRQPTAEPRLARAIPGPPRAVIADRSARLLDFVQLADRAGDRVEPLSGGLKRRLTIARSLINEPDVLLLDEPTTGLDPQARHVVWDRLFRLKQQGVTLVLTTHYMDEAEQLCDRLVVMDRGRIAAGGSPRELIERYSTPEVLELRFDPAVHENAAEKLASVPAQRREVLADRVLLYVPDGDAALAAVRGLGLEPLTSLVRRSTLEDVFLRLTGRRLED